MPKYFLGIDPGQKGAIAVVNEGGELIKVIPFASSIRKLWKQNIINPVVIKNELKSISEDFSEFSALVERVNAREQGRNSAFNFGANSIGIILILETLGIPVKSVEPETWKDVMQVSSKFLGSSGDLKLLSRAKARRMFSSWEFANTKTSDEEEASLLAWLNWNSSK